MKKILAILLCLATALTMSLTAFAATELKDNPTFGNPEGDYTIGVDATYVAGGMQETDISVDIIWEEMEFTYTIASHGKWNPSEHSYDESGEMGWSDNKPSITVRNHSICAVEAGFDFVPDDDVEDLTGTFYIKNDDFDIVPVEDENASFNLWSALGTNRDDEYEYYDQTPTATVYFGVSGGAIDGDKSLGTIVVTVAEGVNTVTTEEELVSVLNRIVAIGGTVKLANDIDLTANGGATYVSVYGGTKTSPTTLDLGGHTLTGTVSCGVAYGTDNNIVIRNGTVEYSSATMQNSNAVIVAYGCKLQLNDVTVNASDIYAVAAVYGGSIDAIDCAFNGGIKPDGTNTFTVMNMSDMTFSEAITIEGYIVATDEWTVIIKEGCVCDINGTEQQTAPSDVTMNKDSYPGSWIEILS